MCWEQLDDCTHSWPSLPDLRDMHVPHKSKHTYVYAHLSGALAAAGLHSCTVTSKTTLQHASDRGAQLSTQCQSGIYDVTQAATNIDVTQAATNSHDCRCHAPRLACAHAKHNRAQTLPTGVCRLLGTPPSDRPDIAGWVAHGTPTKHPPSWESTAQQLTAVGAPFRCR